MKIAVPDLISPSYFPAIAAVDLGYAAEAGVDLTLELRFPVTDAAAALRDGEIAFLAGAAHAPAHLPGGWDDIGLVMALSQHTYWFLVVRSDAAGPRGDLAALRGLRIAAAPGPDLGLYELLADAGIDRAEAGLDIVPVPSAGKDAVSFGVNAAEALAKGSIDGFWANGMGAEVAVTSGTGTVVVDARRGDGPPGSRHYTFAALMTTRRLAADNPAAVTALAGAVRRAQSALAKDPALATDVGRRLFPAMEAELIAELIARDAPYYSPDITDEAISGLDRLIRHHGLPSTPPAAATSVRL